MRRSLLLAAGLLITASPAATQENGRFLFDFSAGDDVQHAAMAQRVVADGRGIADAAIVLCSTTTDDRGRDHRRAVIAALQDAGAAAHRILDAGRCNPEITGRSNDAIGPDRVWLALSSVAYLEQHRRQRLGL